MNPFEKIEHEIMLPLIEVLEKATKDFRKLAQANQMPADEQKPAKKLVDWSCPLLKGCNTNYGELFELCSYGAWLSSQGRCPSLTLLRLAPPSTPTSNWQVYHQGETNLQALHDAGFCVEIKCSFIDVTGKLIQQNKTTYEGALRMSTRYAQHYRVIGIRKGFIDVLESAT